MIHRTHPTLTGESGAVFSDCEKYRDRIKGDDTEHALITPLLLPLARVRSCLPGAGHQAQLYTALPSANQRQGRAIHSDLLAGVGLCTHQQRTSDRMAQGLPHLLQRPAPAFRAWLQAPSIPHRRE